MDGMLWAAGRVALAALGLLGISFTADGWNVLSLTVLTVVAAVSCALGVRTLVAMRARGL